MAFPLAIAGAVMTGASMVKGAMDSKKSAKSIKKAGKASANVINMEGRENMRRLKRVQEQEFGRSTAAGYASNLKMTGSTESYLTDMAAEQRREVNWLMRETAARANAAYRGASTQASNLQRTTTANLMAGLGSLAMRVGG